MMLCVLGFGWWTELAAAQGRPWEFSGGLSADSTTTKDSAAPDIARSEAAGVFVRGKKTNPTPRGSVVTELGGDRRWSIGTKGETSDVSGSVVRNDATPRTSSSIAIGGGYRRWKNALDLPLGTSSGDSIVMQERASLELRGGVALDRLNRLIVSSYGRRRWKYLGGSDAGGAIGVERSVSETVRSSLAAKVMQSWDPGLLILSTTREVEAGATWTPEIRTMINFAAGMGTAIRSEETVRYGTYGASYQRRVEYFAIIGEVARRFDRIADDRGPTLLDSASVRFESSYATDRMFSLSASGSQERLNGQAGVSTAKATVGHRWKFGSTLAGQKRDPSETVIVTVNRETRAEANRSFVYHRVSATWSHSF